MRLFLKEKTHFKVYKVKLKIIIIILFILIFLALFSYYISFRLFPSIERIADSAANSEYHLIVQKAVLDVINNENIKYDDLIIIEKNNNGDIAFVNSNVILMNNLKSKIAINIINKANELNEFDIKVPLIQLFKNTIFTVGKISVPVHVQALNEVVVNFDTEFTESGINQTNSKIIVSVKLLYSVITPVSLKESEINCEVPVGHSIIVGNIPDSFVNVTSDPETVKDDILQLAP